MGDDTQDSPPPRAIRSWQAYLDQPATTQPAAMQPAPVEPPVVDEPPPPWEPSGGVKHPNHHEYLVRMVTWFAAVPWETCARAWDRFAGTLPELVRAAIGAACARIWTALDADDDVAQAEYITRGLAAQRLRLHGYAEHRHFVVLGIDPRAFELIGWFLQEHIDDRRTPPTASRIVQWALEKFAEDPVAEGETPLIPETDAPRPERQLWSAPPVAAEALPAAEERALLAAFAAKL